MLSRVSASPIGVWLYKIQLLIAPIRAITHSSSIMLNPPRVRTRWPLEALAPKTENARLEVRLHARQMPSEERMD
jgi:hypothetical protein